MGRVGQHFTEHAVASIPEARPMAVSGQPEIVSMAAPVRARRGAVVVVAAAAALGGFLFGYDTPLINGTVEGDIEVAHFLELQAGARVSGNISYSTLKLDCGATVDGKLQRVGENPAAAEGSKEAGPKILSFAKSP
mgnify:CR=1 FL=1